MHNDTTNVVQNLYDDEPRYAPQAVMTVKGKRPVVRTTAYPAGSHPQECPLVPDCVALELITDIGVSRWYGCKTAEINSELRMVITGFPRRFEEMAAWAKVPLPSLSDASRILKPLGITIRFDRETQEYWCNFKGGREATRYYTSDINDAIGTGKMMAATAAKGDK